jgi:hypothetical protein
MKSFHQRIAFEFSAATFGPLVAAALLAVGLAFHSAPASAALTRSLQAYGTSSGPGTCSITIESFGFDPEQAARGGSSIESPFIINVSIPTHSSASNSASLIRNDVDAVLPADYVVTIHPSYPSVVVINRTTGTFTMSISENVPGQEYAEVNTPVPMLDPAGLVMIAIVLAVAAAWWVGRRRRAEATPI